MTKQAALYSLVWSRAELAAREAVSACGPETHALNCGFAWIELRPATHPFVRWHKANGIGNKHWQSGRQIRNPGGFSGQQVDHKEAGANAMATVIRDEVRDGGTLTVNVGSRLD